jgi:hypothetical protein
MWINRLRGPFRACFAAARRRLRIQGIGEPMKRMILAAIVLVVALEQAAATEEQLIFDYEAIVACQSDAEKFCKGIALGEGRIAACIKQNVLKLTPGCAEALARIVAQQSQPSGP